MAVAVRFLIFCSLVPCCLLAGRIQYDVRFSGIDDASLLEILKTHSDLVTLKDRPPASVTGLRFRIQADIPQLLETLRSFAYYAAHITYEIEVQEDHFLVHLIVDAGKPFTLSSYEILHGYCDTLASIRSCHLNELSDVGLSKNQIADAASILRAETAALTQLSRCGYPLAYIDKRRVIVDMAAQTVDAAICIHEGPLSRFGPITFFGLKNVNPRFIERKIAWNEGEKFDIDLVDETQSRILKSDLFSSVLITHAQELDDSGGLSMKVRLAEAKHRNISIGFFYATVDGPGGSLCWTHRNFHGMGEYLSIEGNVSPKFSSGTLVFRKPDFYHIDQTFNITAEASRENITAYRAFTYLGTIRIEREYGAKGVLSAGLLGEYVNVHKSANNGHFLIAGLPLYGKYTTADAPLDPTKGLMVSYLLTPYQSLNRSDVHYVKQRLITNFYIPLTQHGKTVLALHAEVGSIAGAMQKNVPLPLLFLGGSEDDLRGYGYKTVSPLSRKKGRTDKDSPKGGRSAIFTTLELRIRASKSIGIVPFADFGTVAAQESPRILTKWYRSVGIGLRYFTFFGPLRLDVGFPLDKRKNLDTWGKIYASIGQCF
jgi:translocation and assembly module TamA